MSPEQLNLLTWAVGGIFAAGLVWAVVAGISGYATQKKKREQLLSALNAHKNPQGGYEASFEGTPYKFSMEVLNDKNLPTLVLSLGHVFSGSFVLEKETLIDRLFQSFGISREIRTGDDVFDGNFFIASDTEDAVRHYFLEEPRRRAVAAVFKAGISKIEHTGKEILFHKYPAPKEAAEITAILRNAKALLGDAPRGFPAAPATASRASRVLTGGAWANAAPFVFGAVGFGIYVWGQCYQIFDGSGLIFFSLKFSVPALLCFLMAILSFLKGRSYSHKIFLTLLAGACLCFGFGGIGVATLLNVKLDHGPESYHNALVTDRVKEGEDNTPYVYVMAWKIGRGSEKVKVTEQVFDQAVPGKAVALLVTKPGKFGFEWFVRGQIVPKEQFDVMKNEARKKAQVNPSYYL